MGSLVDDAKKLLQEKGGRMTHQRLLIFEALECLESHPTADDVYEVVRLRDSSLNLSTVYRTLRWLEQEGLISARRFDEEGRQERFDSVLPSEHHHFFCRTCHNVIEFDDPLISKVKTEFERHNGAQIESVSLMLYGVCHACQPEQEARTWPQVGQGYIPSTGQGD